MSFNSIEFLIFFAAVFPLYCAFGKQNQNRLLLLASYLFYGWVEPRFVVLMALTTAVDFYVGIQIEDAENDSTRKRWLVFSLVMNLTLLGVFKYLGFFSANIHALCELLGFKGSWPVLELILPAGISFYTFHEISYVTDVYRKHIKAARNFWDFALFISFFPQLVAGPIGRATWQLPQFQRSRSMSYEGWSEGTALFVIGMFRKIAVADPLGALARQVFDHPENCSRVTLLLGLYCFSFQIYADFAGYSDMARGLARIMGFELIQNFEHPYFSTNITEFWRRWHISLSTWLRDYLYIPLGGNRHGRWRTDLNLFLTMFLGGLWHGASWNFAVWGALHGIFLGVHKLIAGRRHKSTITPASNPDTHPAPVTESPKIPVFAHPQLTVLNVFKAFATFHLVALAWIFFASKELDRAWFFLTGLFVSHGKHAMTGEAVKFSSGSLTSAGVALIIMLLLVDVPQYLKRDECAILRWPYLSRTLAFSVLVITIILTRGVENAAFLYFKF